MEVGPDHQRQRAVARGVQAKDQDPDRVAVGGNGRDAVLGVARFGPDHDAEGRRLADPGRERSEEHTSELQSRQYLVCRLLLEKKKNNSASEATLPPLT